MGNAGVVDSISLTAIANSIGSTGGFVGFVVDDVGNSNGFTVVSCGFVVDDDDDALHKWQMMRKATKS